MLWPILGCRGEAAHWRRCFGLGPGGEGREQVAIALQGIAGQEPICIDVIISALILDLVRLFVVCECFMVLEILHAISAIKKFFKFLVWKVAKHLLVAVLLRCGHLLPVHVDLEARLATDLKQDPVVVVVDLRGQRIPIVKRLVHALLERFLLSIELEHAGNFLEGQLCSQLDSRLGSSPF